jgi:hypothetical protein
MKDKDLTSALTQRRLFSREWDHKAWNPEINSHNRLKEGEKKREQQETWTGQSKLHGVWHAG